jgi:hypothetical protein
LDNGIYLAPFQFEAAFLSSAHSDEDIEKTVAARAGVVRKFFSAADQRVQTLICVVVLFFYPRESVFISGP